jgi:predicted amidohydrolase
VKLVVSLAQISVAPAQPEANLEKGERLIEEAARRGSQLVCFPEMWTTGFQWSANERMAREHEVAIARVAGLAARYGLWVNGSMLALDEDGRVSNTSFLFGPAGEAAGLYRKTHLFTFFHEDRHMAAGKRLTVADTPWGRTGFAVCYDLRFPELFRTYALKGVKVLLLPAAWPYPRIEHWKVLVRARAIENQFFMLCTNQVGSESFGEDGSVTYFGNSVIVDPWGRTVAEAGETEEILLTASLDLDAVDETRNTMRVLQDRRPELYDLG